MRVVIIEALRWTGRQLSSTDVMRICDSQVSISFVSYHMRELVKTGTIVEVGSRQIRGATERFYGLR